MDSRIAVFSTIILLFSCLVAYPDVKFSGSAYNETSVINSDEAVQYGNRSNLHLKAVSLSEGAKLVAELDFYMLYGYLTSQTAGADDPQTAALAEQLKDGQFYVDRLYMKFPVLSADVILGKQRIAWGSGTIFRPTDTFNRPNPLSLSGRKEGVNALITKIFTGDLSALEFVIAPADIFRRIDDQINLGRLKYSKFASRFTLNKFRADMAFSYQYNGESENHICGFDIKGDLKLGYHLETVFIYNRDAFEAGNMSDYWQSVLGLDYSFGGKWFLLGEYLYNGQGRESESDLSATDFSSLDAFWYRHYLYSRVLYQPDVFWGVNMAVIWNMVDKSLILSPGINYSLFQNTDMGIYGQFFLGDENDEYGPSRLGVDQVYYLRLTVKF